MKIVVLDGYTLNPGDLSWGPMEEFGECVVYDRTPAELVVERARRAEVAMTNKTLMPPDVLDALDNLRYIGVLATGINVLDPAAARARGITVTNVPAYSTPGVAQMTFAHLLNLSQRVSEHAASVRRGDWSACEDFCYWTAALTELDGLTMGLIGLGRIGRRVAELAEAFGMRVLACDAAQAARRQAPPGVTFTDLDDLLARSDVVSLHCPLSVETERLIDADRLARMKPTAFLINTARGPLIDERALADALNSGRLAGAGLDVLGIEPPAADNPLLTASNCHITPHIAWATRAARRRLLNTAAANLRAFLAGEPANVVN